MNIQQKLNAIKKYKNFHLRIYQQNNYWNVGVIKVGKCDPDIPAELFVQETTVARGLKKLLSAIKYHAPKIKK